ncbi:MAG: hypothetical protein ACFFD4_11435 [Candidatus Odinarchaeota archaeon]
MKTKCHKCGKNICNECITSTGDREINADNVDPDSLERMTREGKIDYHEASGSGYWRVPAHYTMKCYYCPPCARDYSIFRTYGLLYPFQKKSIPLLLTLPFLVLIVIILLFDYLKTSFDIDFGEFEPVMNEPVLAIMIFSIGAILVIPGCWLLYRLLVAKAREKKKNFLDSIDPQIKEDIVEKTDKEIINDFAKYTTKFQEFYSQPD